MDDAYRHAGSFLRMFPSLRRVVMQKSPETGGSFFFLFFPLSHHRKLLRSRVPSLFPTRRPVCATKTDGCSTVTSGLVIGTGSKDRVFKSTDHAHCRHIARQNPPYSPETSDWDCLRAAPPGNFVGPTQRGCYKNS